MALCIQFLCYRGVNEIDLLKACISQQNPGGASIGKYYDGPPENVRSDAADIDYLLRTVRRFFPNTDLERNDIISSWAGLRPLIADPRLGPSDISRSHQIQQSQRNWWDVAGGKLTTYRLIAEQTVHQICRVLGNSFAPCTTENRPLLDPEKTSGISQIIPPPFSRELVEHFCQHEWALHLDDVLMRRSIWHFYDGPVRERAKLCADWMAALLNWSQHDRDRELARYLDASDLPATHAFKATLPPSKIVRR
jgi:glycerol-3-phosphate dehydrogenase